MVRHHLDMIFASCFSIQNQDLVKIESSLREIVEFEGGGKGDVGVVEP
jgi:hypothetical protein